VDLVAVTLLHLMFEEQSAVQVRNAAQQVSDFPGSVFFLLGKAFKKKGTEKGFVVAAASPTPCWDGIL
ncbi:MAG: hypothetical protein ACE5GQ_11350, partial [Nitrospinales bacterium]